MTWTAFAILAMFYINPDPKILVFAPLEEKKMGWESKENIWRRPHRRNSKKIVTFILLSYLNKSTSYLICEERGSRNLNKILSESAAPFAGNMVGNEDALKTSTSQNVEIYTNVSQNIHPRF